MIMLLRRPVVRALSKPVYYSTRAIPSVNGHSRLRAAIWGAGVYLVATGLSLQTIHLDAPGPLIAAEQTFTDPDTQISFPTSLRVPSRQHLPDLTLLGAGVRRVSFLGVKVYSVGFYADLSHPAVVAALSDSRLTADEKIERIVRVATCLIRIVPTRATSHTHLRDAFMRAMQMRVALAKKADSLSPEQEQMIQTPLRVLKSLFPNTSVAKNTPFEILLTEAASSGQPRALVFRDLGAVENDWVATEFALSYFEGAGPSPPLKKQVLDRVDSLGN